MSVLPFTSPVFGTIGFFAAPVVGVAVGVSLSSIMMACALGGAILWLPNIALGAFLPDDLVWLPFNLMREYMLAIAAAALGAAILSLPIMPILTTAALGAGITIGFEVCCGLHALVIEAMTSFSRSDDERNDERNTATSGRRPGNK